MKLGLSLANWGSGPPADMDEKAVLADSLRFDSLWTAEAYGSDALTPLAYLAAKTSRIRLGSGIVQMAARTPAATAMAALTLDHLSGGRFILGLGVSGPQVVEGWYGRPFSKPLEWTREYMEIVRAIVRRQGPVHHSGEQYTLPLPGGTGLGKALKSSLHPLRPHLPIFLAAEGPKNVALAAEIADGWLPLFYSPRHDDHYREALEEGFARRGGGPEQFEIVASVKVVIDDDLTRAADVIRPHLALYIGGMGSHDRNFHRNVFVRMGYGQVVEKICALYLSGQRAEAAAAIPLALVEDVALIGPIEKIYHELKMWRRSLVTILVVDAPLTQLRTIANLLNSR